MDACRQAERLFGFFLIIQMSGGQCRAEAEGAGGEQHVLDGWVDRRARMTGGLTFPMIDAGDDLYGRFVEMVSQIFHSGVLAAVFLFRGTGRRL